MNLYRIILWLLCSSLFPLDTVLATELSSIEQSTIKKAKKHIRYRNYARAVDELSLLLEQKNIDAQFIMGSLYRSGKGVKKDSKKAIYYYQQAAEGGLKEAQYSLASLLEKKAKSQNEQNIFFQWYQKSAKKGHLKAIKKLQHLKKQRSLKISSKDDIFSAIVRNNTTKIRQLINQNVSFNVLDHKSRTPLQVALLTKHKAIAQMVLPLSDLKQISHDRDLIPLHLSVANNYANIVESLIHLGIDINETNSFGHNALFIATRRNDKLLVDVLLKNKANPLSNNKQHSNALTLAMTLKNEAVLKVYERYGYSLVKDKINVSKIDLTTFRQQLKDKKSIYANWPLINIASLLGEQNIVAELLSKKIGQHKTDKDGFNALHRAASQDHINIVTLLLDSGFSIESMNKKNETALLIATQSGAFKVVKYLLSQQANPNISSKSKSSPLLSAVFNKDIKMINHLLKVTKEPSIIYQSLLLAMQKKLEAISIKLYKKSSLKHKKDRYGRSLLWHSVDNNLLSLTQSMLNETSDDIDHLDHNGYSPLALAVSQSSNNSVPLLLKHKANLDVQTIEGNSLLMLAIMAENDEFIRHFINHKPLLDVQNKVGNTALILATLKGHQHYVKWLLQAGANTLIRNKRHYNAFQIAENLAYDAISKLIKNDSNRYFGLFK